jgi:ferredoxin
MIGFAFTGFGSNSSGSGLQITRCLCTGVVRALEAIARLRCVGCLECLTACFVRIIASTLISMRHFQKGKLLDKLVEQQLGYVSLL